MAKRSCDTEHLRDYPDCYEECDHDKCVGIDLSQLSEAEAGAYEVIDGKLVKGYSGYLGERRESHDSPVW